MSNDGHAREKSVNTVRSAMLKKIVGENEVLTSKSKVDLSRLPPCIDSLVPHIGRVNYRHANYKPSSQVDLLVPQPLLSWPGLGTNRGRYLRACVVEQTCASPSLVDLLQKTVEEAEVEQDDGQEIDFEELLSDDEDM